MNNNLTMGRKNEGEVSGDVTVAGGGTTPAV